MQHANLLACKTCGHGKVFLTLSVFSLLAVVALSLPVYASFEYTDFSSTNGLTLVPGAEKVLNLWGEDVIRLAAYHGASPNYVGAVWYSEKQDVLAGFETTFTFNLNTQTGGGGAGFAFVVQNERYNAIGAQSGNLGYGDFTFYDLSLPVGISHSVAVEFDTECNLPWWDNDPYGHHVALQSNGTGPNDARHKDPYMKGIAELSINLEDGGNEVSSYGSTWKGTDHTAKIVYTQGSWSVFIDDMATPKLTATYDISGIGLDDGYAWVGFTAADSGATQNHDIKSWSFAPISAPVPEPASLITLAIGGVGILAGLRRKR